MYRLHQINLFAEAFTNLKKSEFYEEPPAEVKTAVEQKKKVPNKSVSRNTVVVNPKQVSLYYKIQPVPYIQVRLLSFFQC